MPANTRHKTKYPGVFYVIGTAISTGKPEKIYYIRYRKDGKEVEEKAGRQFQNDMTPARAAQVRARKIAGELTNREQREEEERRKAAEQNQWTIDRLWTRYKFSNPHLKGLVQDENRYSNYIKPAFGDREPFSLDPFAVDSLRIKLAKKKQPGTVKNVLELLRRIINFGVKKNICSGPAFRIEMPKVNNQKTEDLTPEQLSNLLKAIEASTNRQAANLMKLALFTGLRRGEMFKLQWRHIDYDKGFIVIEDPKGGVDQKVPLNNAARTLLQKHPRSKRSPYVFPGRHGKQRTDIKHQVNDIKEKAGLPASFRALHGLRHVYASMLASSGQVDMYTLQKLLTHKSPLMTQRYAHLRDESLKKASALAGDIIQEAANNDRDHKNKAKTA